MSKSLDSKDYGSDFEKSEIPRWIQDANWEMGSDSANSGPEGFTKYASDNGNMYLRANPEEESYVLEGERTGGEKRFGMRKTLAEGQKEVAAVLDEIGL